jgi:ABC-2 type transport system permease protein
MTKLWKVTAHEFRRTAVTRAFLILTILGPFLITAMGVVPTLVSTSASQRVSEIAVLGMPEPLYREVGPLLEGLKIRLIQWQEGEAQADARVLAGKLYGYLVFPEDPLSALSLTLITREVADYRILEALKSVIGQAQVTRRLNAAGLESSSIRGLIAMPEIVNQQVTKSGRKVQSDLLSSILIGVTFTFMLYMTILLYGQSIGRSVVQEKTSRTVEIMLSSLEARDLLFGKILGQAAASLLQYGVWIGMALLFLRLLSPVLQMQRLPQLGGALPFYLVLFFLLGFFLYSAVYAALGAAAEDEQNLGTLSWPVLIFLMVPMVGVGGIVMNPASPLVVAMSLFPLTAPIVMFVRLMLSEPAAWQVVLSVVLLLLSILGVMALSAKIFSVGILMTGRRFRWGDILRWLRA